MSRQSVEINTEDARIPFFLHYINRNETRLNKKLTYPALYKIVKEAVYLAGKLKVTPHSFAIPL